VIWSTLYISSTWLVISVFENVRDDLGGCRAGMALVGSPLTPSHLGDDGE
jgi:hypothetical protein